MANLTITEISKKYNITTDTIRYYERIGLLPNIPRKSNGNRYFTDGMQHFLEMVICLRHSGVSVDSLVEYVALIQEGDATLDARKELLEEQRDLLEEKEHNLQRSIDRLNHKISLYESGEITEDKSYFKEYKINED
ncbi:MerR family transcriptional regulator [Lactobacillus mulieris]|uniref:MerR family transcriptional regulator n=1 Tax=Lactobacillus mulieris TaxID=2508708 RepID=UPI0014328CF3|nr:MerR family transcriptional regulator [Lactobacillus mulieris]MDK6803749.1 MerR family transcriptional regulator [Lactobacillus mulieris]MDK8382923.1 MerR family transcriptional regulator [Lactobacillus mulieris]MDT9621037.1 MerR family transcriptional regulator [Lactobacillus mulieris]NKC42105.1 MerR family transcriptional regulator [Lactobacillus mulieris]